MVPSNQRALTSLEHEPIILYRHTHPSNSIFNSNYFNNNFNIFNNIYHNHHHQYHHNHNHNPNKHHKKPKKPKRHKEKAKDPPKPPPPPPQPRDPQRTLFHDKTKGEEFTQERALAILKNYPNWDVAEHVDTDVDTGFTELFGDDPRPRPLDKPCAAKKVNRRPLREPQGFFEIFFKPFENFSNIVAFSIICSSFLDNHHFIENTLPLSRTHRIIENTPKFSRIQGIQLFSRISTTKVSRTHLCKFLRIGLTSIPSTRSIHTQVFNHVSTTVLQPSSTTTVSSNATFRQQQQYQHHQPQKSYQHPYPHHQMFSQQHIMMHQHQQLPQHQPFPMQQITPPSKQTHWFDQMCEFITTQQSRHEAGSLDTPPMLTPNNYVQWASRFLRFIELKKPHGKYMRKVIIEGPFETPTNTVAGDPNTDPPRPDSRVPFTDAQLTAEQLLHKEADEYAMIYLLQGIPNPTFRSVDAHKTAKAMWENVHLLMEGTQLNQEDMESKLYMEYTHFMIEPMESLESYYHRFTNIINDLDRHNIILPKIAINTKFLGCLGPDWQKSIRKPTLSFHHHHQIPFHFISRVSLQSLKMAAARIRSSATTLSKLTSSSTSVSRAVICPSFTNTQQSRNFAAPAAPAPPKEQKIKPLPAEEEKELKETLQHILGKGKTVKLEQKIDPSILGGLVVEFGQKVFDMSIKTRARQMERFLRDPINFDA
ncbi:hypothetical protein CTI12_AA009420 [Artemisia annua]|uniref:Uncharacterized protein n=1 Tax=Artemisia annua TaxID=35608 RepID=A0A2U1QHA9_ARTAN|nr:hypothetical protein CTI12_AA009420 [Artemisia annua]